MRAVAGEAGAAAEDQALDGSPRPPRAAGARRRRAVGDWLRHPPPALLFVLAPAVAVGIALWMSHGVWGGRPPAGDDTLPHVIRAQFASSHLFSHGRVDGWDPSFILGYQEFLFIGPGFTWAVVLVRLLTFNLLSITGAVKVVAIGSFALLPVVVAFCARSFGLSRRAAGLAGVLALVVNSPFGGAGLQGLFGVGLLTHQFGALFFFLALGGTLRVIRNPSPVWVVFTAATLGALIVSHGISVMIFGVILALIAVCMLVASDLPTIATYRAWVRHTIADEVERRLAVAGAAADHAPDHTAEHGHANGREAPDTPPGAAELPPLIPRVLVRLVVAYALAGALAALVLFPLLAHRNLRGILTGWGTPPLGERLLQLWRGELVFRPGVPVLLVAGFAYGLVRVWKGKPFALAVVAVPLLYEIVASVALHEWPSNVVSQQLTNRGLGFACVLAVLPLAAAIARATRSAGLVGDLIALAVAAGIVVVPIGSTDSSAQQMAQPVPQMTMAAAVLRENVPPNARFVTQRDFPGEIARTGVVDPDRWLAWASGRNTLDSFNVESSVTPGPAYESEHVTDRPPDVVADALARLGVTHLITVSDPAADQIAASPRFTLIWRQPPLAIFAVTPSAGQPDPSALLTATVPLQARLVSGSPEHLQMAVVASAPTVVSAAIGYSPKWHASVNGRAVAVHKGSDGLIQFALPGGPGRVVLSYHQDVWDWLGLIVSVLTTVGLVAWVVGEVRRRGAQGTKSRERTILQRWRAKRTITPRVPNP